MEEGKKRDDYRGVHFSDDERFAFVQRVCELYESQSATIQSCCDAAGISYRAFRLWCTQNATYAEMYKKARDRQDIAYWEDVIRPKAKKSLLRLINGEEYIETKEETGTSPMGAIEKTVTTTKVILPNATAVIFAMKGEYKDRFSERQEITGKDGKELQPSIITVRIPSEPPSDLDD